MFGSAVKEVGNRKGSLLGVCVEGCVGRPAQILVGVAVFIPVGFTVVKTGEGRAQLNACAGIPAVSPRCCNQIVYIQFGVLHASMGKLNCCYSALIVHIGNRSTRGGIFQHQIAEAPAVLCNQINGIVLFGHIECAQIILFIANRLREETDFRQTYIHRESVGVVAIGVVNCGFTKTAEIEVCEIGLIGINFDFDDVFVSRNQLSGINGDFFPIDRQECLRIGGMRCAAPLRQGIVAVITQLGAVLEPGMVKHQIRRCCRL